MSQALAKPGILSLAAGFTDNRILPREIVAKAIRELEQSGSNEHLQYGTNAGRPGLRSAILQFLRQAHGESVPTSIENVIVTNGSQQALYLLVQTLCDPGDIVLVEQPTYFVFLQLLQSLGVKPLSMPAREDGNLDVSDLAAQIDLLKRSGQWDRVKCAYFVTFFDNPAGRCMPLQVKQDLGILLRSQAPDLPIIEDSAYRELFFDQPHDAPSCLSMHQWRGQPIVYLGSFSKSFASGLKVGFAVSNTEAILKSMLRFKGPQDFGTTHFSQAIIERVLLGPDLPSYLRSSRAHYRAKALELNDALSAGGLRELGWRWNHPNGGLLLWIEGPEDFDSSIDSAFCRACLEKEVLYVPGDLCFANGERRNGARLSFGAIPGEQIPEAAERFCSAVRSISKNTALA